MLMSYKYDTEVPQTVVDGIGVPTMLFHRAQRLANEFGKTHFVGIVRKINPHYREEKVPSSVTGLVLDILTAPFVQSHSSRTIRTGEYVISDCRDDVLAYGCGELLWFTPAHRPGVHSRLDTLLDIVMDDGAGISIPTLLCDAAAAIQRMPARSEKDNQLIDKILERAAQLQNVLDLAKK